MKPHNAARLLLSRHAAEIAEALRDGNKTRAAALMEVPVKVWLEEIAKEGSQ